jgi:hypothetical protein
MVIKHKNTTDIILKTYYEVYNELGYGFLERVYQNAMLKNPFKSVQSVLLSINIDNFLSIPNNS